MKDGILIRKWYTPGKDGYQELIVVPQVAKRSVLEQLHDSKVTGGHFALHKTLERTRQRFWWPMMRRDIDKWIKSCRPCAARSTAGRNLKAELPPITVGVRLAKVAANILGPVTRNRDTGNKYILVITDYFTKYVITVALSTITAADVAKAFVEKWVLRFGAPDTLHTDQGTNFCSELMTEVCTLLNIEGTWTSPYHPQGNGQVERHNIVLADVISKYCSENPGEWESILPYVQFVYNTTVHKSTGETPFSLVFGDEAVYPIDLMFPKPPDTELTVHEYTQLLDGKFREAHMCARETLGAVQQRQKDKFFKKTYGKPYQRDDKVWLFSPQLAKSKKFYLPWTGPYTVVRKINEVNYEICSEKNKKKNQIVHYNRLKPFRTRSENDDQHLRQSTRIAERLTTERYDADHLPSSDDEDDTLLQRNRRIHRRVREPVYDMWDDDNIGGDIQDFFTEPPQIMTPIPEINDDQEPATNEIEPEQEVTIYEIEEQPAIVADEQNSIDDDEQRRYARRTRRPVDRMGL